MCVRISEAVEHHLSRTLANFSAWDPDCGEAWVNQACNGRIADTGYSDLFRNGPTPLLQFFHGTNTDDLVRADDCVNVWVFDDEVSGYETAFRVVERMIHILTPWV